MCYRLPKRDLNCGPWVLNLNKYILLYTKYFFRDLSIPEAASCLCSLSSCQNSTIFLFPTSTTNTLASPPTTTMPTPDFYYLYLHVSLALLSHFIHSMFYPT
uniref:Uncharacterized protein n=1 Tax=Cacopsylla melanoneura TaxID=428564 RepID=A0A8D8RKT9_9HEMI